jgi:hypothetical protein
MRPWVGECVTTKPLLSKAKINPKLGTLKCTCELNKPERNRMIIAENCILTHSTVFWSAPWAVTTVTDVHCTFAPAETRTLRLCTCLYSCMYSCVVGPRRAHGLKACTTSVPEESFVFQVVFDSIQLTVLFLNSTAPNDEQR